MTVSAKINNGGDVCVRSKGRDMRDGFSVEDHRIRQIAEELIAEEMQFVRAELEMLRADMHQSNLEQRNDLLAFYDDVMSIIRRGLRVAS